jgi:hypothetical protein
MLVKNAVLPRRVAEKARLFLIEHAPHQYIAIGAVLKKFFVRNCCSSQIHAPSVRDIIEPLRMPETSVSRSSASFADERFDARKHRS